MVSMVAPTREYTHGWFGRSVFIQLFGRPHNFSDITGNPNARRIIAAYARQSGSRSIFCPQVGHANKRIVGPDSFPEKIMQDGVSIFFGVCADGVELPERSAFFIASADCPTLVLRFPDGRVIATHAGRECLFDRLLFGNETKRDMSSVVYTALSRFSGDIKEVHASIFCGVEPAYFTHHIHHPVYGKENARMITHICAHWGRGCFAGEGDIVARGELDLVRLLRAQLEEAGVLPHYIWHDGARTVMDTMSDGSMLWWSHRREDEGRNGVLITRFN